MWDNFPDDWKKLIGDDFGKAYFDLMNYKIQLESTKNVIYPSSNLVFNAFDLSKLSTTKVVIIGQDPYHGIGQANGLAFSVNTQISIPPSLKNIFKELESDLGVSRTDGDLSNWANQGVLLLNSVLTVNKGLPNSHKDIGWKKFTQNVILRLSEKKQNLVFMLWGGQAQKLAKSIDSNKHLVLKSGHPSPLSANRGFWFGNKHFSECNNYLKSSRIQTINW